MTLAYHEHEWSLLNNVRDLTGIFCVFERIFIYYYFSFFCENSGVLTRKIKKQFPLVVLFLPSVSF